MNPAPIKPEVSFADFEKLDIRVGTITQVSEVENSKKLMKPARFLNNDSTQPSITLQSPGRLLVDAAIRSRSGGFSMACLFICRR